MPIARLARPADRDAATRLVGRLLTELGGTPPSPDEMAPVYDRLIAGEGDGFIAVSEEGGAIIGVCTVSYLQAIRTRGRYAIIQEMYVTPEARSAAVGMGLLRFALEHAASNGCSAVELGTPYEGERQIAFYRRAGFVAVGARLRWRPA